MITLFISNIDILSNFLFIARGHAGSRRVSPEPTGSLLMSNMSQYKILQVRSWYSKHFSTSPMLCAYHPIFYPASAQYLAFCVVSISRRLLVMRRPLPILGTIVANKYRDGIYAKLLTLIDKNIISQRTIQFMDKKEDEMGIEKRIPELLRKRINLNNGAHQSINQGFSNFIWRGYEYEMVSHYLDVITANTAAMNFAICLGFQIWYSLMPSLMLTIGYYDFHLILSPEAVKSFKDTTREWSPQTIKLAAELCENLNQSLMQAAGSTLETGGASAESNETGTLEIRGGEETHKVVLRKLVIACLAVCILSTVSYITVSGTELCLQFREGRFQE